MQCDMDAQGESVTIAEQSWISDMLQIGCIACIVDSKPVSLPEVHHMLSGGRRLGHMFTLPICFFHHRSGRNDQEVVSRDQNQRRFEARYGKESDLLEKVRQLVLKQRLAA